MRRVLGSLVFLLAAAALGGAAGCGRQEEPATNPHLKAPEVAPAGHGSRPVPPAPGKKK